jgi:hypothetical protein
MVVQGMAGISFCVAFTSVYAHFAPFSTMVLQLPFSRFIDIPVVFFYDKEVHLWRRGGGGTGATNP